MLLLSVQEMGIQQGPVLSPWVSIFVVTFHPIINYVWMGKKNNACHSYRQTIRTKRLCCKQLIKGSILSFYTEWEH